MQPKPLIPDGLPDYYKHQPEGIDFIIRNRRTILADITGAGKTRQVIDALDRMGAFRTVAFCNSGMKLKFAGEVHYWTGGRRTVSYLEGTKHNFNIGFETTRLDNGETLRIAVNKFNVDCLVLNYELLPYWIDVLMDYNPVAIIADEFHKCNNEKSKRTKALRQLAKGRPFIIGLTNDPVVNKPADLIPILRILDRLKDFGGWINFVRRYCNLRDKAIYIKGGKGEKRTVQDYSGASNTLELNQRLRQMGIMIRRNQEDIFPGMPANQKIMLPVQLSNKDEYLKAEWDVLNFIRCAALQDEEFKVSIAHLPLDEQRVSQLKYSEEKMVAARKATTIVKMSKLRELVSAGKIYAVIEWGEQMIADGHKILIFSDCIATQEALCQAFPEFIRIMGGMTPVAKDRERTRFQTDEICRGGIISMAAGGESITLTKSYHSAFIGFPWTGKTMNQCIGRSAYRLNDPHPITVYYFFTPDTVDDFVLSKLEYKIQIAKQIIDGVHSETILDESIMGAVLGDLMKKASANPDLYNQFR